MGIELTLRASLEGTWCTAPCPVFVAPMLVVFSLNACIVAHDKSDISTVEAEKMKRATSIVLLWLSVRLSLCQGWVVPVNFVGGRTGCRRSRIVMSAITDESSEEDPFSTQKSDAQREQERSELDRRGRRISHTSEILSVKRLPGQTRKA